MARKKVERTDIINDGPLPEHVHAHVQDIYSAMTRPDMVVAVIEFVVFGGEDDGTVARVALCPNCLLKIAACTEKLVEMYPEAFQE